MSKQKTETRSFTVVHGENPEAVKDLAKTLASFSGAEFTTTKTLGWEARAKNSPKIVIADLERYLTLDAMTLSQNGFKGRVSYIEAGPSWIIK